MKDYKKNQFLKLKRLGIDTNKSIIIYVSDRCVVCKLKGFQTGNRILISINHKSIIATFYTIHSRILKGNEASLSEYAWELLNAKEGDKIYLSYHEPLKSLGYIRGKVFGKKFNYHKLKEIVNDIVAGRLSDIHISSFLSVCAGGHLDEQEIILLTKAMINSGKVIKWNKRMIVDKHCIGGLPGNRTTMIIVPIVAAFGLTIPKTSSRAITSSSGTADTMETLARVNLGFDEIMKIVKKENGCLAWGGQSSLSPADDILIKIEQKLDLDSREQLIASILSKKISAGTTHLVIDIPIGKTAKVRSKIEARQLKTDLERVGRKMGLHIKTIFTNGSQPIGYGIGPALEAKDVLNVLRNNKKAHYKLKEKSIMLAGHILEFSPTVKKGKGKEIARKILESGKAWEKFKAICKAQGGMKRLTKKARYIYDYTAINKCKIVKIDNRRIARLAKLAGAPFDKLAGVYLHAMIGDIVENGNPILTIHAESKGKLEYAMKYLKNNRDLVKTKTIY